MPDPSGPEFCITNFKNCYSLWSIRFMIYFFFKIGIISLPTVFLGHLPLQHTLLNCCRLFLCNCGILCTKCAAHCDMHWHRIGLLKADQQLLSQISFLRSYVYYLLVVLFGLATDLFFIWGTLQKLRYN